MSCEINRDIVRNGIVQTVNALLEGEHTSLAEASPATIDSINSQFGEIIIKDGKIEPSDSLIERYLAAFQSAPDPLYSIRDKAALSDMVLFNLTNRLSNPILSKYNGTYYINGEGKVDIDKERALAKNTQRLYDYLAFYNLPKDMVFVGSDLESRNGNIMRVVYTSGNQKTPDAPKQDKVQAIINFLSERFGYTDNVVFTTRTDFYKKYPNTPANVESAVVGDKIYIFKNATNDIVAEEMLHPFVKALKNQNPELFKNLLKIAKIEYPEIGQHVIKNYNPAIAQEEYVAQVLARVFTQGFEEGKSPSFKSLMQEAFDWIKGIFQDLLGYFVIDNTTLPSNLTFNDLADILNTSDTYFNTQFEGTPLYAKRPPSLYDIIYDYVSDANIRDKVDEVFAELPRVVASINKRLSKEEAGRINQFVDAVNGAKGEREELIAQMSMIMNVSRTLLDLDKQVDAANLIEDDNARLAALYSLNKAIDSFSEFTPILMDLSELIKTEVGPQANLRDFYNNINGAIATPTKIRRSIIKKTSSSLINLITDYHADFIKPEIDRIDKAIEVLRAETTTDIQRSAQIDARIKKLQKEKSLLPTRETIERIFEGKYDDASKVSMWIEAYIANPHPLVSGLASMINDIHLEISKEMNTSVNDMQKVIDRVVKTSGKGKRNQQELWKPYTESYKRVTRITEKKNEDGTTSLVPNYVSQRGLLANYSPDYIAKFEEWQAWEDYYRSKIFSLQKEGNVEAANEMKTKWSDILNEKKAFIRDNSERKYIPEVYEMWDLLDKPISMEDGTTATIRELRGDYQNKIHIEQDLLENDLDPESRQAIYEFLDSLIRDMREMRNRYDSKGALKTGSAMQIAETIQEYYDKQREFGEFILTPEMRGIFEADITMLRTRLSRNEIDQEEFDRQLHMIANDEVDPKFYKLIEDYSEQVANYAAILSAIPEIAPILNGTKTAMKDNFTKLREVTKAFRDEDSKIDGIAFEQNRPEVHKEVKQIQEAYEKLKSEASKLKGLSVADAVRVKELQKLKSSGKLTGEEQVELKSLQDQSATNKALYKKYKDEIDNYLNAVAELAQLSTANTTKYYDEKISDIISNLEASDDVKKQVADTMASGSFTVGPTTYRLINGVWNTQKLVDIAPLSPIGDGSAEASKILANYIANNLLTSTDWWTANHYEAYQYNPETYEYEKVKRPIYTWMEIKPKNEEYIIRNQPAFKYKRYNIKEQFENENYQYVMGYVPAPKAGKFQNQRFFDTTGEEKEILEQLRSSYHRIQEPLPQSKKLGDILPSQIKTEGENLVEATMNFKENVGRLFKTNFTASENEDDAYLLGGSMKNSKHKEIPLRFVGKMDEANQSANIAAMLLVFELSTKHWEKLTKFEPFVKSLQNVVDEIGVTETSRRGAKLSFKNLKRAVTGNLKESTEDKDTDNTVLSQTIDNLVNMFVYGKTSKEAILNVMGFDLDMNKASSALMGFSSKAMFILNAFPAAKNTISTAIQSIINANKEQGYYTATDYGWAQAKSLSYSGDYLHDFSRVGDKSYIGQFADYFSALSGNPTNEYDKKTQFTLMKEKGELLSGMKAYSEFNAQMTQLLAIAKSTKVSLNGEMVPIVEAYELDANRNFVLKQGAIVTKDDEVRFSRLVQRVNADVAGRYRQLEKTYLETIPIGKLAMYMNRYFVPMWQNRYAGMRYSAETGNISSGYAYESMSLLKDAIFLYKGNLSTQWKDLSPRERANVYKFIKDLGALVAMAVVVSLMGGGDDKKHLKQNAPLYNYMLGLAIGVNTETQSFIDPTDLIRKAQSPFMAINQLKQLVKVLSLVPPAMLNSDSAYYEHGTGVKDGLHDKGDSKLIAQFLKLIGYTGVQFQPDELVKRQNSLTQLR